MAKVTSRDVQEIVSKLSSEKAKIREEGIKLLNTWLEGERSASFCKNLARNTALLKPDEIPHDETWPFLITLLIDCVLSELSSSKKKTPKLLYAKTLRMAVQKAEDSKLSSNDLPLITVVKSLFSHVWDVLREFHSFQSEYGIILRRLLTVADYRSHMRKKVYSGILLLYMQKIEASLFERSFSGANPKEELFRCILTLHSLLENPPGDFPEALRGDVVKGFITMCSSLRDEGKISRKLIECLNAYLLGDGPNLGYQAMEIHNSVKKFVFHCWFTTHDRNLKVTLIAYARLQLNLTRGGEDGDALVEQLLDVVGRELDQSCTSSTCVTWADAAKEERFGNLTSLQRDLIELASLVFYRGCIHTNKFHYAEKRARMEDFTVYLRNRLMSGKWLWHAAFAHLLHNYHAHLGKRSYVYWFDGMCSGLERILSEANAGHSFDSLYWTLRSLHALFRVTVSLLETEKTPLKPSPSASEKMVCGWQAVWTSLMRDLSMLSNITSVADAAFMLLGDLVLHDTLNMVIAPTDIWNLKCFKSMTPVSTLFFISCYFSKKGSQGDLRDNLILRKSILRGVMDLLTRRDSFILDEHVAVLFPAAVYALSAGIFTLPHHFERTIVSDDLVDADGSSHNLALVNERNEGLRCHYEYFVEALAKINLPSKDKVHLPQSYLGVRLPRQLQVPLLHEMESFIVNALSEDGLKKGSLSDIFLDCALISSLIYGSFVTRQKTETSSFHSKICQYLLNLLDSAASIIEGISMDDRNQGSLVAYSVLEGTCPIGISFKRFLQCRFFMRNGEENIIDPVLYKSVVNRIGRLLQGLYKMYVESAQCVQSWQHDTVPIEASASSSQVEGASTLQCGKSRILDMELDVDDESSDPVVIERSASGVSSSNFRWKMGILTLISNCFPFLPVITWDTLFDVLRKEADCMVFHHILLSLCENPHWSSSVKLSGLVTLINEMAELKMSMKLQCCEVIAAICCLLESLLRLRSDGISMVERDLEKNLKFLSDLAMKIADSNTLDWHGRMKLVECTCNFISLNPLIGQTMIEKMLNLLHDTDYRVRLFLARRISVLFQTWDGHDELFQDVCSNFGTALVAHSKEKVVTAAEVLAAGAQPSPNVETIIVTLMHLAFYSEKIEFEAVFMMCAITAMDPCQRQLVKVAIDNLSKNLHYACRSKYVDQFTGCILFSWVACGVSLAALVQIRDLFVLHVEPKHFLQYCCRWLLPSLILYDDVANLEWLAQVIGQPLPVLVKHHFVSVFAICMTLHCSKNCDSERGALVLQSSMLSLAQMSEDERDKLIKKNLVSIISYMLGNVSCEPNPPLPLFSRERVEHAIRTVVDGFVETEYRPTDAGVIDKIRIFRPDRVFMLIVEMHYKVTAAVNPRHKCHHLSGVEVLISILGQRAAAASTCCYLFNLAGQLISCQPLQDQCCRVISALLRTFNSSPSKETTHALGEQLQCLVSKLVACCIPSESVGENVCKPSPQLLSLLHLLTVESDSSIHDYIRELEPFPEMDIFDRIRAFHSELCRAYSPWDHFLKFVKRSSYLPPRLLLWSLQVLHKKLLTEMSHMRDKTASIYANTFGHQDNEIVQAVWSLVRMCGSDGADSVRALVADFLSRVGIGDPYSVVFHLPGSSSRIHVCGAVNSNVRTEANFSAYSGMPEDLLITLLRTLKKYLMDDSVEVVDMTAQTLRGILSTERGQRALVSFDSYERSLIEIHSKGVDMQLVEKCLLEFEKKLTAEIKSLEESALWCTSEKSYETWICHLVYSLIAYCGDVTLRLCQGIVLSKAEVAELLLPNVMVDLAGRKDLDVDLCKMISSQVQQHIFSESNALNKSIQAILEALNELRLCYVMERCVSAPAPSRRDNSKLSRSSAGYSSRSRSSAKLGDSTATASATSTSAWNKVYWLSIDYLIVAKAAITCGSYFTAVMYVEYWCEDFFKKMTLGDPNFSHNEEVPAHIDVLLLAINRINEPDSLYGVIQTYKLNSQIVTFEHEGNWSKALEYYDLKIRSAGIDGGSKRLSLKHPGSGACTSFSNPQEGMTPWKPHKGLIRSLQQTGCSHVLDIYCQGLISRNDEFQHDLEFVELQYESAWRAGNWDFSLLYTGSHASTPYARGGRFNEGLHSCLRALQEGGSLEFESQLNDLKQALVLSIHNASEEGTEFIYSAIVKLQILDHLTMAWDLRWKPCSNGLSYQERKSTFSEPLTPTMDQLSVLNAEWGRILKETQLNMNFIEPFLAFRKVMLQILGCTECTLQHLLQFSSILRKGLRFSQAAAALHEFKFMCTDLQEPPSALYWLSRLEEAKLLRAQDQHQMAISLGKYIAENTHTSEGTSDVYRLVGKWLAETRSSNSRTILEKYLKPAVLLAGDLRNVNSNFLVMQCKTHFHLAHYADALFRSHEERLNSSEWQAATRLRKHKNLELEALVKRLRSSTKGEKTDYTIKIQELQKQLTLDREEAQKLQDDRDNFLSLTLDGYKRCLIVGDRYDVRVVFRLISLWFNLSSRQSVVNIMLDTVKEVQSSKFIPLVYQIASRIGNAKDVQGPNSFQFALVTLVKKMAIDHPYHTILQLLALANGDRIKDKQRSKNSFVVDMDKKLAAENLLEELSTYHGAIIRQMKQMVEVYIKLAELETKREDTNKRVSLPREIRSIRQLELVPVVTANLPIDRTCQYQEGSFPYFRGLADSVLVMNGINAPKVVECHGSDGKTYRQLAKSGNDDLRQDAVMEQFFDLVNTFLLNHRDTWKRKLGIRTYKVVPFTPSAGVIEWVDGTVPLGEYLIGSTRNGGAHGRYGIGDWSFPKGREHMANAKDKRKAFHEVCNNFRPVMHHFFLERFLQPAEWFERRLAYTRSVAASSMVGYIVGLGDRHSMNILIDQATAEVVHIDLGVAFEQGLMLKTPERVPFRLTRDVIDGMGVAGVEGVFRRCSEQTLAVMRTNKEALLTIIEVFIHDPLYKWALSPLKALQRQKETDDDIVNSWEDSQGEKEGNKDAARALRRVKQKLDGYEEGEMRSLHGQVQQLIQDATDTERLCQMFPGWAAWL